MACEIFNFKASKLNYRSGFIMSRANFLDFIIKELSFIVNVPFTNTFSLFTITYYLKSASFESEK